MCVDSGGIPTTESQPNMSAKLLVSIKKLMEMTI